jgi:large subunit ribosomal protein L2
LELYKTFQKSFSKPRLKQDKMGKRLTQQARGKGGPAHRVRPKAFRYKLSYPLLSDKGIGVVLNLIDSPGHSAPLAKIMLDKKIFFVPAVQGLVQEQEIEIGGDKIEDGNIVALEKTEIGTRVFNIEKRPGDGGKMVRTSGGSATVLKKDDKNIVILMSNKNEIKLNPQCRVTIGIAAGQGRVNKPVVKAGKKHHMMKSRSKMWHRTSAVKVNAVDHPFGGGRGKRIKSKIAKRNAPPGRKVGHLRPKKTGRKKR